MEATPQPAIYQRFDTLASSDLTEFRQFFKRLHKMFPEQAAEACLLYISAHGLDPAAQSMAYWLASDTTYLSVLMDGNGLPVDAAAKSIAVLKEVDPQFLFRFAKAAAALSVTAAILQALILVPALGDYSILIPWLRSLGQNSDTRVRSRAAKLLCELRPNKGLIEKQLQSPEARIRAGAVEALWHSSDPTAVAQLRQVLSDAHHRVVTNALIGLYRHGEPDALEKLRELCTHPDQYFRMAAAWAYGFIQNPAAIPHLQELSRDKSLPVRKRALKSLLALESLKPHEAVESAMPSSPTEQTRIEPAAPESPAPAADDRPDFQFTLFR